MIDKPARYQGQLLALLRAVAVPTAIALALLGAIVGAVLHISTSQTDRFAIQQQDRLVRIAVGQAISGVAREQEASTYWDDAVVKLRQYPLDAGWIDNNLGIWFNTYYHHDETYLLDAANRPVYAMQSGGRAEPASFRRVEHPVLQLVKALRNSLENGAIADANAKAKAKAKTVGASDIALVNGHPAILSLKPVVSETGDIRQAPGSEFIHVSVRYLDGRFLDDLTQTYGIDAPRFSAVPTDGAQLPITSNNGRVLGYLSWAPFAPGEQVEDSMVPALFGAFAAIGAILALLLLRLWRSRVELEASRAQAQHLAFHDSLTGLPNRALFEDRLDHALTRRGTDVALLMLDLDRFKMVNDTLGHQAGDALIREFGLRLSALTREADTISRLGGDEFAILLETERPADVHRLAKRIQGEMERPFEIVGTQVHVGVSIGIAMSSASERDRLELVRQADIALYSAKDAGRNTYCLFRPHMDDGVKLRAKMEDELRLALGRGRGLTVHYQPQVGVDGSILGLEALVRWEHPTRGLISPEQFVPIAEDSGLIVPLGEWVLREACTVSRRYPNLFIALNLSPVQFRSPAFLDRLMSIVRSTGASPEALQLEVTERVLLDDDDAVRATLQRLRSTGFTIVLDDFGTGYSSLSYLRKFEVDKIKIDRSFVQHLGDASDSGTIVSAVLALGHAMGLSVAAEGVETTEQQTFLKLAGCKEMQGYLFSRALPAEELAELLEPAGQASSAA